MLVKKVPNPDTFLASDPPNSQRLLCSISAKARLKLARYGDMRKANCSLHDTKPIVYCRTIRLRQP